MPELPEAETIIRGVRPALLGRSIRRVDVLRPDLIEATSDAFRGSVEGASFGRVTRRGKNLVLSLGPAASGPSLHLVINLGMSGRLLHRPRGDAAPPPSHPGVRFRLDDGSTLVYHDVRRFGRLRLLDSTAFRRWSRSLGPEPLSRSFASARLIVALARSSSPIRSWLLDQRKVAGVGNIYANEALFLARVHPSTPANQITGTEGRRLHRALRSVLREAIVASGTTLRDYRTAANGVGSYGARLRVYGREGSPCLRCGALVERSIFGGRSAFSCPRCQPRKDR